MLSTDDPHMGRIMNYKRSAWSHRFLAAYAWHLRSVIPLHCKKMLPNSEECGASCIQRDKRESVSCVQEAGKV